MDLRIRLLQALGGLLGALLLVAMAINVYSLRADVAAETSASARLVRTLVDAARIDPALPAALAGERLHALSAAAALRHLDLAFAADELPAGDEHRLAALLGIRVRPATVDAIELGERRLYIAANPAAEIDERLGDTVRLLITLLLFSGATLLAAWWSAHRALSPVRELEAGLERLARGDGDAALPGFRLHEFRRVAGAIDALAAALAASRAAQRELAQQLIRVQEDERRALARELHDEMGQTLTAMNATAAHLELHAERLPASEIAACAGELRRDLRQGGSQLRQMLKSLRPHGLDLGGLDGALRELVDGWQARNTGIVFRLQLPGALPRLGNDSALTLYRVVQEALTNVVRHSGARQCTVVLSASEGAISAEIVDDGCGLPCGSATGGGLLGMGERLAMVGGKLQASRESDGGLRLCAVLPLDADLNDDGKRKNDQHRPD